MGASLLCGIRRRAPQAGRCKNLREVGVLWLAGALCVLPPKVSAASGQKIFSMQREHMIETQLKDRGIKDPRVLDAMRQIPRHFFVPADIQDEAYEDRPLPIGLSQTISQPYIVAYMTEALQIKPTDKVLEIGTGSGYQAAILAKLAGAVYTVEILEPLWAQAKKVISRLQIPKISFKLADGRAGWPEASPFDKIMVTAAADKIPSELYAQLKEGGLILFPFGEQGDVQTLVLGKKIGGRVKTKELLAVRFVPLLHDRTKHLSEEKK